MKSKVFLFNKHFFKENTKIVFVERVNHYLHDSLLTQQ